MRQGVGPLGLPVSTAASGWPIPGCVSANAATPNRRAFLFPIGCNTSLPPDTEHPRLPVELLCPPPAELEAECARRRRKDLPLLLPLQRDAPKESSELPAGRLAGVGRCVAPWRSYRPNPPFDERKRSVREAARNRCQTPSHESTGVGYQCQDRLLQPGAPRTN